MCMRRCKSSARLTSHTVGNFTTSSLLEAVDKASGEKVMLCPNCWIENAVVQVRKEGRYDPDDRPEDVLDQVSYVCKTIHTKPSDEKEGFIGKKRPLPDSAEDVSKKVMAG